MAAKEAAFRYVPFYLNDKGLRHQEDLKTWNEG
jgi:hypothetical protein